MDGSSDARHLKKTIRHYAAEEREMGFWANRKRNRAVARYASELPNWLSRSYGTGTHYTPGQIGAAIKALKLDPAYTVFALAAYVSEGNFTAQPDDLVKGWTYQQALDLFIPICRQINF